MLLLGSDELEMEWSRKAQEDMKFSAGIDLLLTGGGDGLAEAEIALVQRPPNHHAHNSVVKPRGQTADIVKR